MHRQCFFQPFLQAPRRARIDSFQLPEDFLQRLFGLRVVVHRIRVAHSSIVVFLAVLGLPDLPTALLPPRCSPWLLATLPKRAFLHLPRSPEPPLAPGRQSECHLSSTPRDSDLLSAVRTAPATGCYWRPQTAGSRCSSRSRSLPEHSPPLADSSVWTTRPPCVPAPLVAAFRLAATDRSSPVPLPGLRGFVPAVVPAEFSVQQKPHNPAAFPSAHTPRWDWADAEVLPGE